jgi:pectate lyase
MIGMNMKAGLRKSCSMLLLVLVLLVTAAVGASPALVQAAGPASLGIITNFNVQDSANSADWSLQYSLQTGDKQYGDQNTTWTALKDPYYGWQWIQTAADSKSYTGSTLASFKVLVRAQIYVAADKSKAIPSWLSDWYDTDDDITNSAGKTFRVYKKDVGANTTVSLGSAAAGGEMYSVMVKDLSPVGWASANALGQNGTTGGLGGVTVTATTQAELEAYAASAEPLVIRVQGTIQMSPWGARIPVKSNKTILGMGTNATLQYGGLQVTNNEKNVIIRNLTIKDSFQSWDGKLGDWDAITVQNGAHHVWIDRCTLTHMEDGLVDVVKGADYVTVSNTEFSNHNKTFAVGNDEYDNRPKVTIHHNFFNGTNQRNPRVNNSDVHVFNNYFLNLGDYGTASHNTAQVLLEANYFRNSEDITTLGDSTANVVFTSDNIKENCTGVNQTGGTTFNPASSYTYVKDSASSVPAYVLKSAGAGKIRK